MPCLAGETPELPPKDVPFLPLGERFLWLSETVLPLFPLRDADSVAVLRFGGLLSLRAFFRLPKPSLRAKVRAAIAARLHLATQGRVRQVSGLVGSGHLCMKPMYCGMPAQG